MKIRLDRDDCISCGVCWSECPEIFIEDSDSKTSIAEEFRVSGDNSLGEAPETLRSSAESAADSCPVSIIHVE
ncbi:ferredoxin [Spirochaetota bacterium]